MRWEDYLIAVLDDLELQAEGLFLAGRQDDVQALALAGYADVDLAARFQGATGARIGLVLPDGINVSGTVSKAGRGWVLLAGESGPVIALTARLVFASGLPDTGVPEPARPLRAGLRVGTALRALVEGRQPCVLHCLGGHRVEGDVARVGRDFVEVRSGRAARVVPTDALLMVREAR